MNQEIILRIKRISDLKDSEFDYGLDNFQDYDGFVITTDQQHIRLLFQNKNVGFEQSACELLTVNDSLDSFCGAVLKDISRNTGNSLLKEIEVDPIFARSVHSVQVFALDIHTSNGLLQFVAYNNSPGVFPHQIFVLSEQIELSEVL